MTGFAVVGGVAFLVVVGIVYLAVYLHWVRSATAGLAYFGATLDERRALKRRIARYGWLARPLVAVLARFNRGRSGLPAFEYEGVCGPPGVSSRAAFERAHRYRPRPEDVFVVTQMRCGTTWMQQLVHQIVTRGRGSFDDPGCSHLYALSPWIEVHDGIPVEAAVPIGEPPTRIVKTHLPSTLCPFDACARYIYVARHPVSCFASIVDFDRTLVGPLLPPVPVLADWFCSDRMYWLPWPRHVDGWWRRSCDSPNVLFVHFEAMKRDFAAVRDEVARFLGCELTALEKQRIDERCAFGYMKRHEESFEMAAPTMFSARAGNQLPSGKESRHDDVAADVRARIERYCRAALSDAAYPVARFYPDLGTAPPTATPEGRSPA